MATPKQETKQSGLRLWHIIVLALLLALSVYMIVQFFEQQAILERQQVRLEELREQLRLLEEEFSDVSRELIDAGSPAYIERYLRKWGMIKEGEIVILVTTAPTTEP